MMDGNDLWDEDRVLLIRASRPPWGNVIELRIGDRSGGKMALAQPATFITRESDASFVQPMLTLHQGSAQALMDELWNVGIRPSEGTGNTGQVAAMQRHLDDMRKLVFERWEPSMERVK